LNPVHWDHDAGVAAGFPGVVVHGLLQAGWALRVAAAATDSPRPFTSAKFRFRNPLLPARPVSYEIVQGEGSIAVTLADEDTEYLSASVAITHG
jgi:acyl dehydratase